jgi:predicted ArsR family transcriptional regulator
MKPGQARLTRNKQEMVMSHEHLLSAGEVANRLGISRMQFYRIHDQLIVGGLEPVDVIAGGRTRYTASSLTRMIRRAAERSNPIVKEVPLVVIGQGAFVTEVGIC